MTYGCPWCGSRDLSLVEFGEDLGFQVICCRCAGTGPNADTREQAVLAYLERVDKDDIALDKYLQTKQ